MLAIFKREMRSYFTTSVGYIFLATTVLISAAIFWITTFYSETADTSTFFASLIFILMIFLPILTMKLFSDEKRTKTEQLLLTSPVTTTQMVLGKFFSAISILAIFLVSTLVFVLPLFSVTAKDASGPNMALVFGNLIALFLVGMCFVAIGLLISSLTENQFAAIVLTIVVLLFLLSINLLKSFIEVYFIRVILDWLSIFSRYNAFTYGIFDISALIYYVSLTAFVLFLTVRVFEVRKFS